MRAEEWLHQNNLQEALRELEDEIRRNPAAPKLRVFLFQLLAVLGQYDRARVQLDAAAEMDESNLLLRAMYKPALEAFAEREEVLAGRRTPTLLGQPEEWMAWVIQALQLQADGKCRQAAELRGRAFEAAPAVPGTIDGKAFEWLADADSRFGPILEAVVNGRYSWVPLQRVRRIVFEPPQDLRDLVWATAQVMWENGGESMALIPVRYAQSEASEDPLIRLARKTDWLDQGEQCATGLGQRMLATDQAEYPLLEVRQVLFQGGAAEGGHE